MRPVAIRHAMPAASARAIASAVRADGWNVSSSTVPSRSIATARTARASSPGGSCSTAGAPGTGRSTCRRPTPRRRRRSSASWPVSSLGGIGPPPFSICFATRSAVSGARLSRSGPTLPVVPASLSVWQPPQVAVNDDLPAARSAPEPPPVVVPVLAAGPSPVRRRSRPSIPSRPWTPSRRDSARAASVPPAADGFTVCAVEPSPTVISPEIVVLATFDAKQPVAPTATAARTRSTGSTRRARMPNSLPSAAAESVGGCPPPRDRR